MKSQDEEVHRERSRGVLSAGASVPTKVASLLTCECVHQPGRSSNPVIQEFS